MKRMQRLLSVLLACCLAVFACPLENRAAAAEPKAANSVTVTVKATEETSDKDVVVSDAVVTLFVGAKAVRTANTNSDGKATLSLSGLTNEQIQNATVSAYKTVSRGKGIQGSARDPLFNYFPKDSSGNYIRYEYELHSETVDSNGNWLGADLPITYKNSNRVDIAFVIDSTGSMADEITNTKNNVAAFSEKLASQGYDIRFSIIEYRDLDEGEDTKIHVLNGSHWYSDVPSVKGILSDITVDGGGDTPESLLDALGMVASPDMYWRSNAYKFAFVLTDANYKKGNNYGYSSMEEVVSALAGKGIVTSVITSSGYKSTYSSLYNGTGGVYANINSRDFNSEMMSLADNIVSFTVADMELTLSEPRMLYNLSVCYLADDSQSQSADYRNSVKNMLSEYAKDVAQTTDGHVMIHKVLLFSTDSLMNFYNTSDKASMADIRIETRENDGTVRVHSNAYPDGFYSDAKVSSISSIDAFKNLPNPEKYKDNKETFLRIQLSGIEGAGWENSLKTQAAQYATTVTHESGHYIFGFFDEYLDKDNSQWGVQYKRPYGNYGLMDGQHEDIEMSKAGIDYSYFGGTFPDSSHTKNTYHSYWYGEACEDTLADLLTSGSSSLKEVPFYTSPYTVSYTKTPGTTDRTASYSYAELGSDSFIEPHDLRSMGSVGRSAVSSAYFDGFTGTSEPVGTVSISPGSHSVRFALSGKTGYSYRLYLQKKGETNYTDYPLEGTGKNLFCELPVKAGELAEIRLIGENSGTGLFNTYFVDRSGPTTEGYLYSSPDNCVFAYTEGRTDSGYTFFAENTQYTNGDFTSLNQATNILADNAFQGEIYSVVSCGGDVDYSTISWFKYAGGSWKKLSTDLSMEENLNVGARADLSGPGLYVVMGKEAVKSPAIAVTNLSYTQSETRDAVIHITFNDQNENRKYYNVYYSDRPFSSAKEEGVLAKTYDASGIEGREVSLDLDLLERERKVYVAVEAVLENGSRSPLAKTEARAGAADKDGDGIPDWYCDKYLLWPKPGETKDIASSDDDRDGLTNLQEYLGGSDPTNPNDPVHTTNVPVESVDVTAETVKLQPGESTTIGAVIRPDNATDASVIWTVEDSSIAEIAASEHECVITGVETGTTTVSAVTQDGGYAASCTVIVGLSFTDVYSSAWYYKEVIEAARTGIISGYPDGSFKPDNAISRQDFVVMLVGMLGAEEEVKAILPETVPFEDCDGSYAFAKRAIAYCADKGYVHGDGAGAFRPNQKITRQEVASILKDALGLDGTTTDTFNDDASIADWAKTSVYACKDAGIFKGDAGTGNFRPADSIKRLESAIVMNACNAR